MFKQAQNFFLILTFLIAGDCLSQETTRERETVELPPSHQVMVVYNKRSDASKRVAEYYALKRGIPDTHLFGVRISDEETVTRRNYRKDLETPLWKHLVKEGFFKYSKLEIKPEGSKRSVKVEKIESSRIRYLVLCYGIPLRIAHEPTLEEEDTPYSLQSDKLSYNGAAVDSELALLPLLPEAYIRKGPIENPVFGVQEAIEIHPGKGVLMVTRLDGPDEDTAKGLVDKALEAEERGLWGRAYFDLRSIEDPNYKMGDDWIQQAASVAKKAGWETIIDYAPEPIPRSFPLSHVGVYAGWYNTHVCGPFAESEVEFMPGAFAYHLHSHSATSLRTPDQNWVGPLLARGVTATMGCVAEPYLVFTPQVGAFFVRFFAGFSLAEAAYASQGHLSWQTTVVGDPLYRPFNHLPQDLHNRLSAAGDPLLEWSYLRVVNLNQNLNTPIPRLIEFLKNLTLTEDSPVLLEKLGTLYYLINDLENTITAYQRALALSQSQQQKKRLMLNIATKYDESGEDTKALAAFRAFLETFPNYSDVERIQKEINKLDPPLE